MCQHSNLNNLQKLQKFKKYITISVNYILQYNISKIGWFEVGRYGYSRSLEIKQQNYTIEHIRLPISVP